MTTTTAAAAFTAVAPAAGASAQAAAAGVTVTSHFVWTITSAEASGDSTLINNFATNNRPGAMLFITPNWDQGGVCGCAYDPSLPGVWYDTSTRCAAPGLNLTAGAAKIRAVHWRVAGCDAR